MISNIDKLRTIIKSNNKEIEELRKFDPTHMNESSISFDESQTEEELKSIIDKQEKEINKLEILADVEHQKFEQNVINIMEGLKEKEPDKDFSEFYHNGIIVIDSIETKIKDYFIKEIVSNDEIKYSLICTDSRVDNNIFDSIDYSNFNVKRIIYLRKTKVLYEIFKNSYYNKDGKIVLDTFDKIIKFKNDIINNCPPVYHTLVAETMYEQKVGY